MTSRTRLHFMCGKAGAGKSTLSRTLAKQHDAVLISEDIWLARLFPDEMRDFDDYIRYSRRIKQVVEPLVVDMLAHRSVVLDFPANTARSRQWFGSLIQHAQSAHTLHYLRASNAICLRRIAQRNSERPEGSHELDEATFLQITSLFEAPSPAEGFDVQLHEQGA
ncbi:ATP-binding protein [Comamonadaceae bacterium G21597-S1]|nr:ATP-binding protein [Comamonadaceae bacterium G21597-S1]